MVAQMTLACGLPVATQARERLCTKSNSVRCVTIGNAVQL